MTIGRGRPWLATLLRGLIAWGAIGLIWGNLHIHLSHEYDRAISEKINETGSLARVFEAMTIRTIDAMDQVLLITREQYIRDPANFNLRSWARATPFLNDLSIQIAVADATGRVLDSNLGLSSPTVTIADREHFQVHAKGSGDGLYISRPVLGRVSGRASVQFVRPILGADGTFQGVVVASLDPRAISSLYDSVGITRETVVLFGLDGIVRASSPMDGPDRQRLLEPMLLQAARTSIADSYRTGEDDRTGSIVSFRRVGSHPLVIAVADHTAEALVAFQAEQRQYLIIGAGLTLLVLSLHLTDLLYRRRVGRFQQALALTLDNMSQGIIMVDRDRRVPVINRRVISLLGLPPSIAHEGADFDAVLRWQTENEEFAGATGDTPGITERMAAGGLDATTPVYERTRPNGVVLEVRTTVLPDGSAVRTFTDITERRRFEQALADSRDAAQAGARARSEFLAVMSHEIRTPLNGILGAVGLMRGGRLEPEADHYARIIHEAGGYLLTLVDDILDFSSLDTGRLALVPGRFDPAAVLEGVVAMLRPEAIRKGLTLELARAPDPSGPDLPNAVIGDAGRLRQVLVSLVGNAIKFTESGGVRIEAAATVEAWGPEDAGAQASGSPAPMGEAPGGTTHTAWNIQGHIRLSVSIHDTGIGIPAERRARLFEAFTQLDASLSRRFTGSGLGLAISHHLVALMGGAISVDSTPGQGSVFRFDVRLGLAGEPPTQAEPPSHGDKLRVLIAEDNPTNRLVATRMVTRLGHHADAVEDGAEAVATLRHTHYDVVLMDLMMPGMDGITATRTIRAAADPLAMTPIIGLTANARPDDEAACLAAGMDAFLAKPVSAERLGRTLRSVVVAAGRAGASTLSPAAEDRYPDHHPG